MHIHLNGMPVKLLFQVGVHILFDFIANGRIVGFEQQLYIYGIIGSIHLLNDTEGNDVSGESRIINLFKRFNHLFFARHLITPYIIKWISCISNLDAEFNKKITEKEKIFPVEIR